MDLAFEAVGVRVPSLREGLERWASLGLEPVNATADGGGRPSIAVGRDRIELVEASGDEDGSMGKPFPYFALRTRDAAVDAGEVWRDLPLLGSRVRFSAAERPHDVPGELDAHRIESLPWAIHDRDAGAAELEAVLGLVADPAYSDLDFPDLHARNRMIFLGDECYLDLNEGQEGRGPLSKQVRECGNAQFAIVIEPRDLDAAVALLRARAVPTLTQKPIDLRVRWRDGTPGVAARIIAIDPVYLFNARVFLSEPTFPWPAAGDDERTAHVSAP